MASIRAKQREARARAEKIGTTTREDGINKTTVTPAEFLSLYMDECAETTKYLALEVTAHGRVYALLVPRENWVNILRYFKARSDVRFSRSEGDQHHAVGHGLCYIGMAYENAKNLESLFGWDLVKLDSRGHAEMVKTYKARGGTEKNVGFEFERRTAAAIAAQHIGQNDRKSHKYHADIRQADGSEIECKAKFGVITLVRDVGFNRYLIEGAIPFNFFS